MAEVDDGAVRDDAVPDDAVPDDAVPDDAVSEWPTGRLLSAAARLVEHEWNAHLSSWGLTHASVAVLHVLAAGSSSQRALAAAIGVEEQTVSRLVERLERSGLVERHRDPDDRRRFVVSRTRDGERALAEAVDEDAAERLFSPEERETLRPLLTGLVQRLSAARWE
ncbi:MAG: MarR family winged helix-turn-helix transcriptional regulator [Actinomycetes bacterium]